MILGEKEREEEKKDEERGVQYSQTQWVVDYLGSSSETQGAVKGSGPSQKYIELQNVAHACMPSLVIR